MLSRRFFLKSLIGSCLLVGCGDGRQIFHDSANRKISIIALTDTANWVLDTNGARINLFDYDFIDGLTNYVKWSVLEVEPNVYNWKGLDRLLNEAATSGKKLSYNIISGNHAPGWLFDQKMIPAHFCSCCETGSKRTFFPWIESSEGRVLNLSVLEIWENTINNFASYLKGHQFKDSISYVAITGGPTSNGLEIMWSNDYNSDENRWGSLEEELFIEFWKRLVDIFIEKLSDFPLGLAFTDYFPSRNNSCSSERKIEISIEILDYAINAALERNAFVIPMGLWFGNISPNLLSTHTLVNLLKTYPIFAVQGHLYTENEFILENMIEVATEIGSHWIELWHNDILKEEYQGVLEDLTLNKIIDT